MTSPALQEIVALLGCPAAGNPAQYLFERAIDAAGLDWRFVSVDVAPERLAPALAGGEAMGFRGCIVSGPLREPAAALVGACSPATRFAGATNLAVLEEGRLFGHMTEGRGIVEALRAHAEVPGARVLVVGAGATARAAALELALGGAAGILVADADSAAAESLAEALRGLESAAEIGVVAADSPIEVPEGVGIVVVAHADTGMPRLTGLRPDLVLADTALVDQPSALVSQGRDAGCCVIDGIEIRVATTAIDFLALGGVEVDTDLLREALEEFLSA